MHEAEMGNAKSTWDATEDDKPRFCSYSLPPPHPKKKEREKKTALHLQPLLLTRLLLSIIQKQPSLLGHLVKAMASLEQSHPDHDSRQLQYKRD